MKSRLFATIRGTGSLTLPASLAVFSLLLFSIATPRSGWASGLTLTVDGVSAGFTLTVFAKNFPTCCGGVGASGVVATTGGTVLVNAVGGNMWMFPDSDGQDASVTLPTAAYGPAVGVDGMAQSSSNLYMAEFGNHSVVQINSDGTFNRNVANLPPGFNASGMAVFGNGLLVTAADFNGGPPGGGIFFVNPRNGTVTTLFDTVAALGVAVDPATNNKFFALNDLGTVIGLNRPNKLIFIEGPKVGGAAAVLGTGTLTNDLFVTSRPSGTLVEVDLTTGAKSLIATGGIGANLGAQDPTDGTLLFTFGDSVYRLSGGGL
jgi:hypothetical protein